MILGAKAVPSTKLKAWAEVHPSPAFLIVLALLVIALAATLTFRRVTTPWSSLPDYDYWSMIEGLVTGNGLHLTLSNLFRHNNEHLAVIPKLIYAANYLATSGSNTELIIVSIVIGAACSALLLYLARHLLRDTPWRLAACAVLFPLAMFSAKLGEDYFRGMGGVVWLTANLFVILSAAALAKAVASGRPTWLFASLVTGLLGILSSNVAVYSLLVLLVFCLAILFLPRFRNLVPTTSVVIVAALIVVFLGLGFAYRNESSSPWTLNPFALISYVLTSLGNALTMGIQKIQAPMAPLIGFVILAIGVLSIYRLTAERRIGDALLWIMLFFYAPFNALVIGIVRLNHDPSGATASRYQSPVAISLIATIVLMLAALPKPSQSRRSTLLRGAAVATLVVVAVVLTANRAYVGHYTRKSEIKVLSEIAFRQGLESQEHLEGTTHSKQLNLLERLLPDLRAAQHVPFNTVSRCEERLGQHISEAAGSPSGAIDAAFAYPLFGGKGQALEVKGWAERVGTPAECIVIIDGNRTAIGAGASMLMRPDIEREQVRPLGRIGWRAVATLPQVMPVCALALFPGDSEEVPLANCRSSLAAATTPGVVGKKR